MAWVITEGLPGKGIGSWSTALLPGTPTRVYAYSARASTASLTRAIRLEKAHGPIQSLLDVLFRRTPSSTNCARLSDTPGLGLLLTPWRFKTPLLISGIATMVAIVYLLALLRAGKVQRQDAVVRGGGLPRRRRLPDSVLG
jgi:hypothetical protein